MSARISGAEWSAMSIETGSSPRSLLLVTGTNATAKLTLASRLPSLPMTSFETFRPPSVRAGAAGPAAAPPTAQSGATSSIDLLLVTALVALAGLIVRVGWFTPVEAMQGPAQKIFYLKIPSATVALYLGPPPSVARIIVREAVRHTGRAR